MMNKKALEIYVHIPFCVKKCAYCDFLSFPGNLRMRREYTDKLLDEIRFQSGFVKEYQVVSIFFGGGTPSALEAEDITALMEALKEYYDLAPQAEVTMEANPGTMKAEGVAAWKKAGINRISMGLQSADDTELSYLGRIHTYDEFLKSFQRVRMAGFANVNVDLISGIPGQTVESWKSTLKKTAMLKPEHISAYSLIVEEGTPYYERYGDHVEVDACEMSQEDRRRLMALPDLPDEDAEREMYYLTKSYLKEQGYGRYEISNYARPGFECRHNIGYWTGIEYLGLGLGASSCLDGFRFHNTADYKEYVFAHFDDEEEFVGAFRQETERLNVKSRMEEFMYLGLRLTWGVSADDFMNAFGQNIRVVYGSAIDGLLGDGLMETQDGYFRLTERGLDLSNYAMSKFLLD